MLDRREEPLSTDEVFNDFFHLFLLSFFIIISIIFRDSRSSSVYFDLI
jgi:hypothetical protein